MSEDFAWFKEHYTAFQKKYGESFIAIKTMRLQFLNVLMPIIIIKMHLPQLKPSTTNYHLCLIILKSNML